MNGMEKGRLESKHVHLASPSVFDGRVSRVLRARGTSAARLWSIVSSLVAVKMFDNTVLSIVLTPSRARCYLPACEEVLSHEFTFARRSRHGCRIFVCIPHSHPGPGHF